MTRGVAILEIDDIHKSYAMDTGASQAVRGISIAVNQGEFYTLLGPSGCGKTTILRSVAGLEIPEAGSIVIAGELVFCARRRIMRAPRERDIAMVFQSYAIWPHMTVLRNVAFPLEMQGLPGDRVRAEAHAALDAVGLADFADRSATQLSGGQQQRVALARAVAKKAKILLLDEPLSNLDAALRVQMRAELRGLQQRLGTTTIYVTHDQEEALALSDRIALLREGHVVEIGTPQDLYLRPRHAFTAGFLGGSVLLPCEIQARGDGWTDVRTQLGIVRSASVAAGVHERGALLVRPEHIELYPNQMSTLDRNVFEGVVRSRTFGGKFVEYDVEIGGVAMRVQRLAGEEFAPGDIVRIHLPPDRSRVVLADDDQARA